MDYLQLLNSSIRLSAPVILIAMGGLFALKVDVFNMALDAFALIGCFFSIWGAYVTGTLSGGFFIGILCTVLFSLVYAVFVLEWEVNPVVCSVAMITLANGLTRYLMQPVFGTSGNVILSSELALPTIHLSLLDHLPVLGKILNNQTILVYLSLLLPFGIYVFLKYTEIGLSMRACGQSKETARSAGLKVKKIQYLALILNGVFCALAGCQLALSINMFNVGMTSGRGFTALAALVLTNSHPLFALLVGLLFGFADALSNVLSADGYPSQLLGMLPYFLALIAAIVPMAVQSILSRIHIQQQERMLMKI